jgi:uncharacterized OB-fold protein
MLYWICPECGHECSPAIRECPTCTAPPSEQPKAAETTVVQAAAESTGSASQELLSFAKHVEAAPSTALLTAPSTALLTAPPERQLLTSANGHAASHETQGIAAAVSVEEAPREPALSTELASLDDLAVRPARPGRVEPAKLSPAPVPARLSSPSASIVTAPTRAEFGLAAAGLTPGGEISFEGARGKSGAIGQSGEPLPSRRQSVAFVRAELAGTNHSGLALGRLSKLDSIALKPAIPSGDARSMNGASVALASKPSQPSLVSSEVKLSGASLVELLSALRASAEELDRAAIDAIHASFREKPAACLLSAPSEIVRAPAPPADQWMRSQKFQFTAIPPERVARATVIAGPQPPTLAGPSLPPQLLNFHQTASLPGKNKRWSSWLVNLIVAVVVIFAVVSLLQYILQDRDSKTGDTKAVSVAPPVATVKAAPSPRARVVEEHPAARFVEVAGVRIVLGPNKRPQVQYIVINHSASELTGLNIRIAVRSVEALEDPPLFTVSSAVASLGPNQSKEVRVELDPSIQPSAIPDWQSLRTEVLVARQ